MRRYACMELLSKFLFVTILLRFVHRTRWGSQLPRCFASGSTLRVPDSPYHLQLCVHACTMDHAKISSATWRCCPTLTHGSPAPRQPPLFTQGHRSM